MPDNEGVLVGARPAVFAQQWLYLQTDKNPAARCPVEVGMWSASFDKDTHSFSNQEQETRSTEGCGQLAGEGGHRTSPQEPLLQQTFSCSKQFQRSSSCDKPVHAEQTSGDSRFTDRDGPSSQGCHPTGQMDGIYRHQGCLKKKDINCFIIPLFFIFSPNYIL